MKPSRKSLTAERCPRWSGGESLAELPTAALEFAARALMQK
jgi:hypothetical protein